jgi:hypothetical protein
MPSGPPVLAIEPTCSGNRCARAQRLRDEVTNVTVLRSVPMLGLMLDFA